MNYEALLFDLDGTMWDATEQIRESWNLAIKDFPELENRVITKEDLQRVMGLPMDEIAAKLFPELSVERQLEVLEACCQVENAYLTEHGGVLFPKLEETLEQLSKKYKLMIVSNGQAGYIQAFLNAHHLGKYFTDVQNWGDNQVPKGENIKVVMERNGISRAAYVGDTQGDANAAKLAGIDFIYARYGFGNVLEYEKAIDEFGELQSAVNSNT